MEITFYGVNIRDKNIKLPFLNAIEKVVISDNYLNAITFLDIIAKDIGNEINDFDYITCFDENGKLYYRSILNNNTLGAAIPSIKDKLDIMQGAVNWNVAVEKSVIITDEEQKLPKINLDLLDKELTDLQEGPGETKK